MSEERRKSRALQVAFRHHPRQWREYFYVYPVISRRSHGLSIGIELNPDKACNFDCVYCCVDRAQAPRVRKVDLAVLSAELRQMVAQRDSLFEEPEFREIPARFRALHDIAFSGSGEPTASPQFAEAARIAVAVKQEFGLDEAKLITITDACFLARPKVVETLAYLDQHGGEIWAKLDAGTEDYFRQITRPSHPLAHVLANILDAACRRPLVIQSLFLRYRGEPPPEAEISAYVARLRELREQGAQIKEVQVYTIARPAAEVFVSPLEAEALEHIAQAVRAVGIDVSVFP